MIDCSHGNGIRHVYFSRGSRAFRSPLRDKAARRSSPEARCEESASPWAEAETPTRFPRFSRQELIGRFSHLAGDLREGQPLSYDLRNRKMESVRVVHRIVFGGAIVVPKCLFIEIAKQMERLDGNVGSIQ